LLLGKCGEDFLGGGGARDKFAGFLNGNEIAIAESQRASPCC